MENRFAFRYGFEINNEECYQVIFKYPTLWMNAHVICICPLISLMQDQVEQLNSKGIPACFLGSAQKEKRITLAKIYNRNYRAIYVCPEWIEKNILQLRRIMSKIPVALFAIDEGMFSWSFFTYISHNGILKTY